MKIRVIKSKPEDGQDEIVHLLGREFEASIDDKGRANFDLRLQRIRRANLVEPGGMGKSRMNKHEIYEEAVALYNEWYGAEHGAQGSCLYWSFTVGAILLKHGIRDFTLQAGDMQWPMARDRGSNDTHFGYTWSPEDPHSKAQIAAGKLPECHVWLARPTAREIIDFSVRWLPKQARAHGYIWELAHPPLFLWTDRLPDGVNYRPVAEAIRHVVAMRMKELEAA